jgi:hypothetical protein
MPLIPPQRAPLEELALAAAAARGARPAHSAHAVVTQAQQQAYTYPPQMPAYAQPTQYPQPYAPPAAQPVFHIHNTNVQHAYHPTKRWSPGAAALLSLLLPGLGQMYKGQPINGLVWLVVVIVGYAMLILPGAVLHLCCVLGAASGDPYR